MQARQSPLARQRATEAMREPHAKLYATGEVPKEQEERDVTAATTAAT